MKRIFQKATVIGAFAMVGTLTFWAQDADAIPVFSRKYAMACNSCHTMFPKLTKFGVAFRERGFRIAAGKDDLGLQDVRGKNLDTGDSPAAVIAASFPFTVRTQILYSGAGPIEHGGEAVMPGHRAGMLDGALYEDAADNDNWKSNPKIGFGEFGLISAGAYDEFSWWLDANLDGIGMLEGSYYVSDLLKVRFGRVQNNVGYGMTNMSHRPLGWGWVDAAQMAGGTMLMMVDGVSINGTTNGGSGVGTSYNLTMGTFGKNFEQGNKSNTSIYGRVAQEIMGNHIIGIYGYTAKNYSSDAFGGESAMKMAMKDMMGVTTVNAMDFSDVRRYGVDFAVNYGEPLQLWGAFTFGDQTNLNGTKLDMQAATVSGEWKFADAWLAGAKYDSSRTELQMMTAAYLKPTATTNMTVYGVHQIAQNVQAILSVTRTQNAINYMSSALMKTTADQQSFTTGLLAIDIAL